MTIQTTAEHGEPDPGRADPALLTPADAAQKTQAAAQEPGLQAQRMGEVHFAHCAPIL